MIGRATGRPDRPECPDLAPAVEFNLLKTGYAGADIADDLDPEIIAIQRNRPALL